MFQGCSSIYPVYLFHVPGAVDVTKMIFKSGRVRCSFIMVTVTVGYK